MERPSHHAQRHALDSPLRSAWRDLPERYGKWKSVYHRFNRWRGEGLFDRILKALRIRLDKQGKIDWDLWLVDGSNVRASRAAAGAQKRGQGLDREPDDHALGRSRGGWGSKLHVVTDGKGLVLAVTVTAGQRTNPRNSTM